jgi:hypothetical protein
VFGLCVGALLAGVIRQRGVTLNRTQSLAIILGWGFAFFIGQFIQANSFESIRKTLDNNYITKLVAYSMESGIAGLYGSIITLNQLPLNQKRRINWMTAVASLLGFGLGYASIYLISTTSADVYIGQILIWGFLGGITLIIPSKDIKRYLLHGILGSIGLYLGYKILDFSLGGNGFYLAKNASSYISSALFPVLVGGIFGLLFATPIKRISRILVFAVFVIFSFSLFSALTSYLVNMFLHSTFHIFNIARIISAGVLGLLLGTIWSYLNSPTDASLQQPEKN